MLKMSLKYNGREVSANEFSRLLTKDLTQRATEVAVSAVRKRVQSLRCPIHGAAPRVERTAAGLNISGCCTSFIESVKNQIA
jgi:hypothetical protein